MGSESRTRDRIAQIEDRKIEILFEIADIDEDDTGRLSELNAEYVKVDEEHFRIKMELLSKGSTRNRGT